MPLSTQDINSVLEGEGTEYKPLLRCVRDFSAGNLAKRKNLFKVGEQPASGAIGFYRATRGNRQGGRRHFDLGLRIFPLNPQIPFDENTVQGKALRQLQEQNVDVARLYELSRPSEALLHFKQVRSLFERVQRQEEIQDKDRFLVKVAGSALNELSFLMHEGGEYDHIAPPSTYKEFLERLADCKACSEKYASVLKPLLNDDQVEADGLSRLDRFQALNALDFIFFEKVTDTLAVIVLPFVTSPAALLVLPWPDDDAETVKDLAGELLGETKGVIYTYVFSLLIERIREQSTNLDPDQTVDDVVTNFVLRLVEILMPSITKFRDVHGVIHAWPVEGGFSGAVYHEDAEILAVRHSDSACEAKFYSNPFIRNIIHQIDTENSEGNPHELDAVKEFLHKLLELLVQDWYSTRFAYQQQTYASYLPVRDDLNDIIKSINYLRDKATRVEERLNPANYGFLQLGSQMDALFRANTKLWWRNSPKKGRVELAFERPLNKKGGISKGWCPLNTIHNARFADCAVWNKYRPYLKAKGEVTGIELLKAFGDMETSSTPEASKWFRLLKLLFHRPRHGERVYASQLAMSAIVALVTEMAFPTEDEPLVTASAGTGGIEVLWQKTSSALALPGAIRHMCTAFEDWVDLGESAGSSPAASVELPQNVTPARVMGSLMQLIGIELDRRSNDPKSVKLRNVRVHVNDPGEIEIVIKCDGKFSPDRLTQLCALEDTASAHGLRSTLRTLCDAVNQRNPRHYTWENVRRVGDGDQVTLDEVRSFSEVCGDRFLIITGGDKPRSQGFDPTSTPAGSGDPAQDSLTTTLFYVRFADPTASRGARHGPFRSHMQLDGGVSDTEGQLRPTSQTSPVENEDVEYTLYLLNLTGRTSDRLSTLQGVAPEFGLSCDFRDLLTDEGAQPNSIQVQPHFESGAIVEGRPALVFIHITEWMTLARDAVKWNWMEMQDLQVVVYSGNGVPDDLAPGLADADRKVAETYGIEPNHIHVLPRDYPGENETLARHIVRTFLETYTSMPIEEARRVVGSRIREAIAAPPLELSVLLDRLGSAAWNETDAAEDGFDDDDRVGERFMAWLHAFDLSNRGTAETEGCRLVSENVWKGAERDLCSTLAGERNKALRDHAIRVLHGLQDSEASRDGQVSLRPLRDAELIRLMGAFRELVGAQASQLRDQP